MRCQNALLFPHASPGARVDEILVSLCSCVKLTSLVSCLNIDTVELEATRLPCEIQAAAIFIDDLPQVLERLQ